jgi:hypothetical protein
MTQREFSKLECQEVSSCSFLSSRMYSRNGNGVTYDDRRCVLGPIAAIKLAKSHPT